MSHRLQRMTSRMAWCAGLLAATFGVSAHASDVRVGQPLPQWQAGELDIHHINTGRGDATFFLLPDGTSLLVDASGRTHERAPFTFPTRPNDSRPPGEWVARYVQKTLPTTAKGLDYALITHFHGDHMGVIDADSPPSQLGGDYRLSGITEVGDRLPIATLIDRGWPDYQTPKPLRGENIDNYRRFVAWQADHRGVQMQRFQPGANQQIHLLHAPGDYPQFELRNLYANGEIWTGAGTTTRKLAPSDADQASGLSLSENALSTAFRLSYGAFDYFSGGDLSSIEAEQRANVPAWIDVETAVGIAAGPVDVLKANHHGSWDANSPSFLAAVQPRTIVVTARADGHPAANTFKRMTSPHLWRGEREIFISHISAATAATTYGVENATGGQGHIVVRVAPGGDSYRVIVLDDSDESRTVIAIHGPYRSQTHAADEASPR